MKKLIQIVSFLALTFVVGGTAIQAQSGTKIDADIPFDFVIGDKVFPAGAYVIRLRRVPSGAEALELRDAKGKFLYDTFALPNGDTGKRKAELVFDRSEGLAALSKIRTEGKGYSVPVVKTAGQIASKERKAGNGISN
jgi:hypothetical protein